MSSLLFPPGLTPQQVAAQLCAAIYDYPDGPRTRWGAQTAFGSTSPVYWRMKVVNGVPYWVCRGSANIPDWFHDFRHLAIPMKDLLVGWVHPGFNLGTGAATSEIRKTAKQLGLSIARSYIVGHSLGATHADIITGKLVAYGDPPGGRIVFGEPRPGFSQLCGLASSVAGWSYVNTKVGGDLFEHDLVTDVPLKLPWLFRYNRPTPLIEVHRPPNPDDEWGPLAYHHMRYYEEALRT